MPYLNSTPYGRTLEKYSTYSLAHELIHRLDAITQKDMDDNDSLPDDIAGRLKDSLLETALAITVYSQ